MPLARVARKARSSRTGAYNETTIAQILPWHLTRANPFENLLGKGVQPPICRGNNRLTVTEPID
jgi:hypothetical protein